MVGCYRYAKLSIEVSVIGQVESFINAQSHSQSPPPGSCLQAGARSLRRRVGGKAGAGLFQAQGGEREYKRFLRVISREISRLSNYKEVKLRLALLRYGDVHAFTI